MPADASVADILGDPRAELPYGWAQTPAREYFGFGREFLPQTILEIGTRLGASLIALIKGAWSRRPLRVASVDNDFDLVGARPAGKLRLLNCFPDDVDWTWIDLDSKSGPGLTAIRDWATGVGAVDLCHIDGDHHYDYVLSDLDICWAVVRPGGVVIGHDVKHRGIPECGQAWNDWCARHVTEIEWRRDIAYQVDYGLIGGGLIDGHGITIIMKRIPAEQST